MEWVKVKVKHVLNTGLNDEELGRLIKIQALIALKERHPSDAEIATVITPKNAKKLAEKLENLGENLSNIAEKVLEDVEKTMKNRQKTAEKVRNHRTKSRLFDENVTGYTPGYVTDASNGVVTALDKNREDKNRVTSSPKPSSSNAADAADDARLKIKPEKKEDPDSPEVIWGNWPPTNLSYTDWKQVGPLALAVATYYRRADNPEAYAKTMRNTLQGSPKLTVETWHKQLGIVVKMRKTKATGDRMDYVFKKHEEFLKLSGFKREKVLKIALELHQALLTPEQRHLFQVEQKNYPDNAEREMIDSIVTAMEELEVVPIAA